MSHAKKSDKIFERQRLSSKDTPIFKYIFCWAYYLGCALTIRFFIIGNIDTFNIAFSIFWWGMFPFVVRNFQLAKVVHLNEDRLEFHHWLKRKSIPMKEIKKVEYLRRSKSEKCTIRFKPGANPKSIFFYMPSRLERYEAHPVIRFISDRYKANTKRKLTIRET